MITSVGIKNFKCFQNVTVKFAPLTVLTGMNGGGKSSLIQAILLARQASENSKAEVVQLNGPYCLEIGEADDALYAAADDQTISVEIATERAKGSAVPEEPFAFTALLEQRSLHLPIKARPSSIPQILSGSGMAFSYLNAERLGPRDQLSVTSAHMSEIGVGSRGEYVAQALALRERDNIPESLRHPSASGVLTLRAQVEAWVSDIVRPVRIDTQWPPGVTASMIRFQAPHLASQPLRPGIIGFGVSYSLPIIVAGLTVGGGMLIVENPEAHLHPAGQSKLGRFLGRVAGAGTQVLIETHSDHILNGIRRAAVSDKTISPSDVLIHFMTGTPAAPITIDVTAKGGLSIWPQGFFDQLDEDLGSLARAKRASG